MTRLAVAAIDVLRLRREAQVGSWFGPGRPLSTWRFVLNAGVGMAFVDHLPPRIAGWQADIFRSLQFRLQHV